MITYELMINDWVSYIGNGKQEKRKVLEITCLKQVELWDGENMSSWFLVGEKYIEPIPLTSEILKANGFEEDPEDGTMCWGNKELEEVTWRGTILKIDSLSASLELVSCMYIHQLQHALKLCGIGIEIIL